MSTIIPGLYGLDSYSAWRTFSKDPQKYLDRFAKDKSVQKEIEYFNKKAPTFENVDALMKDRRALQYLLDSYGLGSEINNAGRLKKILTEDPTSESALVNRLADNRFAQMAQSLRFDQGMDKLSRGTFLDTVQDRYIRNEFEEALGQQDNALRQAAHFARASSGISDVYQVLSDRILWNVTTAAFNIPQQFAIQSVETQAKYLSGRIDFTKFSDGKNISVTANQLTRAKSDFAMLQTNLGVSDNAVQQIKTLQAQLNQLTTDYTNVTANTDPGGANAATIALQNAAVPELIRFEQFMQSGVEALNGIDKQLNLIEGFIAQAQVPGADLASLKSQFSAFVAGVNTSIAGAAITAPDGSEQNIFGANETLSITLNDTGATVTLNRHDLSDFQTALAQAETAFNAISDSNDMANIYAAQGRVLVAKDQIAAVSNTLESDITDFEGKVGGSPFYATLNTEAIQKGHASVTDSLSRLAKIEDLLSKITDLAATSRKRDEGADRSDLDVTFEDYKTQIRDLIENASAGELDNFLNNAPDQSYELNTGNAIHVKGGYDLATTISNVLDAGSLLDRSSAEALEVSSIQVTNATDAAKAGLEKSQPLLDHALNTYDPRGKLDYQIYAIRASLEDLLASAASADGKHNLLSPDQKNLSLTLSTGVSSTFRAQNSFASSITASLDALVEAAASGDNAAILAALNDSLYIVDSTKRSLDSDNRMGTMELGKLGGIVDMLEPKSSENVENPYKINAYTEKFLMRYLMQDGGSTTAVNSPNSYVLSLFGNGGGSDNSSVFSSIMNLSMQV